MTRLPRIKMNGTKQDETLAHNKEWTAVVDKQGMRD